MFDQMTLVKIVGGFCGALLVFLFANWAAQTLYFGGEGGDTRPPAFTVAVADAAPASTDDAAAEPDIATLLNNVDVAAGEKSFHACKACHHIDGTNATGPHLNGVVNRPRATVEGFAYSDAMLSKKGDPWTAANLYLFLKSPKADVPGTKMGFAGLPKPQDRANVIAYLATLK